MVRACFRSFPFNLLIRNPPGLFKRSSASSGRAMDVDLSPPASVKGMKALNRDAFNKDVVLPSLVLPMANIGSAIKLLKPYLLKLSNFQCIRPLVDPDGDECTVDGTASPVNSCSKLAILNPTIFSGSDSLGDAIKAELSKHGMNLNVKWIKIALNYSNWKADEVLRAVIPDSFEGVRGYSLIGHIVHLNLKEELHEYKNIIGQVLLDKIKQAQTVVNKTENIDSTFRNFKMEILAGGNNMVVNVKQNKCNFQFDFSKVYWNPRLSTEHERIVSFLRRDDVLFDVFAGVGPFSIPAAKKGCTVFANDLNPESVKWLLKSAELNNVKDRLTVFKKDASEFIKEDFKREIMNLKKENNYFVHVVMNLPAIAIDFLKCFQGLFSPPEFEHVKAIPTPYIYVYLFCKNADNSKGMAKNLVENSLGLELADEVTDIFFVRNVAPNKDMMRVTLRLSEKVLRSSPKRPASDKCAQEDPVKKVCAR